MPSAFQFSCLGGSDLAFLSALFSNDEVLELVHEGRMPLYVDLQTST